jgi:hypothetical protein
MNNKIKKKKRLSCLVGMLMLLRLDAVGVHNLLPMFSLHSSMEAFPFLSVVLFPKPGFKKMHLMSKLHEYSIAAGEGWDRAHLLLGHWATLQAAHLCVLALNHSLRYPSWEFHMGEIP